MRDRDFFKFRRDFILRRHGYHRDMHYGNERSKRVARFRCLCGWAGDRLELHFAQVKPQRDKFGAHA